MGANRAEQMVRCPGCTCLVFEDELDINDGVCAECYFAGGGAE